MNIKNPLYKNQGIHVLATIFTIDKGSVKVLLIKRKNSPYKGYWSLVGGAVYNNETLDEAMKREIIVFKNTPVGYAIFHSCQVHTI